jgi:triphosphatase
MEIEAKFRATKRIKAGDIEKLDLSPYLLGEKVTHDLRDTLLDTESYAVRGAKHSLRIRYDNKVGILTLKGPKIVQGATHVRSEIEVFLGDGEPLEPTTWATEIADPVQAIIGEAPLQRLMTIHNRRRTWDLYHNGAIVGEVALDRGKIVAGGASEKLHEVEIELKGEGTLAHLDALMAKFTAQLPLEAESLSKAQRAWALWERMYMVDDALKGAAARVAMKPDAPLAEAGRSVLAEHLRKLRKALPIAEAGEDPEGVHQARVATRRLRAVMAELGGVVYEARQIQVLRRGLRTVARTLGVVRDADVFLIALDGYANQHDEAFRTGLQPLYDFVHHQREKGRKGMFALLGSHKHACLIDQLVAFVTIEGEGNIKAQETEGIAPSRVQDFAGSMIWSRYEAIRAYENVVGTADLPTLHQLRIEVKRLRYVLDLFSDALEESKPLRQACADMQEHLGDLNDTAVAIALLDTLDEHHEGTPALAEYRADVLKRQRALYDATPNAVISVLGSEFRMALAGAIAKL